MPWGRERWAPWGPAGAAALVLGTAVAVWVWAWATPWLALLKGVLQGSWGGPNRAADTGAEISHPLWGPGRSGRWRALWV